MCPQKYLFLLGQERKCVNEGRESLPMRAKNQKWTSLWSKMDYTLDGDTKKSIEAHFPSLDSFKAGLNF